MDQSKQQDSVYETKLSLLSKRCAEIEQDNDRLLSLICQTSRYIKKGLKRRRLLVRYLSKYEDPLTLQRPPELVQVKDEEPPSMTNGVKEKETKKHTLTDKSCSVTPGTSTSKTVATKTVTTSTPKTRKKNKETSGPKKPMNAYLLFCQTNRAIISQEYQAVEGKEINSNDLTKELASKWKQMDQSQRQVYLNQYEVEKQRYIKSLQANQPQDKDKDKETK